MTASAGIIGVGIAAALGVGLLQGALHCSGMCGPFVLAFGLSTRDGPSGGAAGAKPERRSWGLAPLHLAHNAGRISAFTLLGAIFGGLGHFVDTAARLTGAQAVAGLIGGAAMLLWAIDEARTGHGGFSIERWSLLSWGPVQQGFRRWLSRRDPRGAFLSGGLLGLHPCGLLYAMLLSAAATASAWRGALIMLAFGVGTVPALLAAVVIGASGILFVLRGLAVNGWIPQVNPWLF